MTVNINGQDISYEKDTSLLAFLRDDLQLTAVKDGCSEGACGTCTVLIDGKATRACLMKLSALAGKRVLTVEGLTEREKQVYAFCFADAGAVQCGFCIPGMVMSAKALLDVNPSPSASDVKKAIRGNLCRCTGYVKIEAAILQAAAFLRSGDVMPVQVDSARLGELVHRLDAQEKTLGTGRYVDDIIVPDMLYAKALRTPYPRAKILRIDTADALAHPDAVRIITAADITGNPKMGHLLKDWDALIAVGDISRYVGDAIALAVARTQESLHEILSRIIVEAEELPPLTNPQQALAEGAPHLHAGGNLLKEERLSRGDADAALATATHVVTQHYSLPFTEHAFMEPECAIAQPEGDGLLLLTGGQSIYDERREIASLLGLSPEHIHVKSCLVGGGFGGKEDMSVQHHAALAAWLCRKPVKVKLTRAESIAIHPKRHAMEIDFTTGCDAQGNIVAVKVRILSDTGAYASLGGPVLQRACTHAAGPYHFENIDIIGKAVYTNNPPGGAFRGFGVTQSAFAMECNLNLLATKVGISPWEIRYRNAIRPGQSLPNGQIADESTALVACLLAVKDTYESATFAGIATSFKNAGLGVGIPDTSRCILSVEQGRIHIRSSAACIGQGMATVMLQMACETLALPPSKFVVEPPDTARTPNAGTTTASRQTVLTGEAVVLACQQIKARLALGDSLSSLEGQEFYAEFCPPTDPLGSDKPHPVSHVAYGYAAQVVTLSETGAVTGVHCAYDVGTLVNPRACEGQIEGGVVMGLGYALTEDYPLVKARPTAKLGTLGLFRSTDVPPIKISFVKTEKPLSYAHGSKGVGELATIPTAPAVQGAYFALDGNFRTSLPLRQTKYRK